MKRAMPIGCWIWWSLLEEGSVGEEMKRIWGALLTTVILGLLGCGGDSSSSGNNSDEQQIESIENLDLSGTWLLRTETEVYNTATNDYLYSEFFYQRFVLEDLAAGVRYRRCGQGFNYGSSYGIKSGNRLYLGLFDHPYDYLGDNAFGLTTEIEEDMYFTERSSRQVISLVKMSDDVLPGAGQFSLLSPMEFDADSEVCVSTSFSSIGTRKSVFIESRYNGMTVGVNLGFYEELAVGTYQWVYGDYTGAQQFRAVGLSFDDDLTESIWGNYHLYIDEAEIVIDQLDDEAFSAHIIFEDEQANSGELSFTVDSSWLIFDSNE